MLQLLQRGDRSAQEPATRMGHIEFFPMLVLRIYLLARKDPKTKTNSTLHLQKA